MKSFDDICGFKIPADEMTLPNNIKNIESVFDNKACPRDPWRDGRCIWHADAEEKSRGNIIAGLKAESDGNEKGSDLYVESWGSLHGAKLSDIDLSYISFKNAKLNDADLSGADLSECDLSGAILTGANLSDACLTSANLSGADLTNANITEVYFHNANLSGAYLSNLSFIDIDMSSTNLNNCQCYGSLFSKTRLTNTNLSNSNLLQSRFEKSDMKFSNLEGANLEGVNMCEVNLKGSSLVSGNVSEATILDCNFTGANLKSVEFDGTNLAGNYLYSARLQDVHISDRTIFEGPPGDWIDGDPVNMGERCPEERLSDPDLSIFERICQGFKQATAFYQMDGPDTDEDGVSSFEKARNAYRERERLYRENSLTDRISEAYVGAKRAEQRDALAKNEWLSYLDLSARKWLMGYGENPWQLMWVSGFVITVCALFYPFIGGFRVGDDLNQTVAVSVRALLSDLVTSILQFNVGAITSVDPISAIGQVLSMAFTTVYFSVVTFTTLGYGDIQPHGRLVKTLAAAESFAGVVILAMFVAVVARNKMR
ncbi:pentapeptide repeat-containing protein [Halococcoides cellulosivorans]|uniref:Potassium channel domain-containing protein n=1 Tax=Halococcoides cellulosivorans TaxID=1679096 RepID=A0A2R4WZD2_9EURY|nr:pentapeptide repeat-containing protein [Halococcoides cellulosivorans]AWB26875.1 hypothetical protein HARCEL1_03660 [Halococcoides cellulosivorans]